MKKRPAPPGCPAGDVVPHRPLAPTPREGIDLPLTARQSVILDQRAVRLAFHAELERIGDDRREGGELPAVVRTEVARLGVHERKRAHPLARGRLQRMARIEHYARLFRDERVGREARVLARVRDHQRFAAGDGMGAETHRAPELRGRETCARLDPRAVLVHEGDQADRRAEMGGGQEDHAVVGFLARRVEDAHALECAEPRELVERRRARRHRKQHGDAGEQDPLAAHVLMVAKMRRPSTAQISYAVPSSRASESKR